jgi:hypothetical protein
MNILTRIVSFCLALCLLIPVVSQAQETRVVRTQTSLYAEPLTSSVVLDVLSPGMSVEVMQRQGQWVMVRMPGTAEAGWIEGRGLDQVSAAEPSAARPGVSPRITREEMGLARSRVQDLDNSLNRIEGRIDRLAGELEPATQPSAGPIGIEVLSPPPVGTVPDAMESLRADSPLGYHWSNRFMMGKYFRGKEDLYGVSLSRILDGLGRAAFFGEFSYALGNRHGKSDDFMEWSLGLRYNIRAPHYLIYPYLESGVGMRHPMAGHDPGPIRYLAWTPGVGISAELGRVYMVSVGAQSVFLFHGGRRYNEGRVYFSCSYKY